MKRIIVTVGPSLLHKVPIRELHRANYLYRINGAHGTTASIEGYLREIRRQVPAAEILMDLPGNKVRTANLQRPIQLKTGRSFVLKSYETNYPVFYRHLRKGDVVWANDSIFKFTVEKVARERILFRSHSNGTLLNNKGLHVRGIHASIPFLFQRDLDLIALANKHRIDFVGLSFVRHVRDIREAMKKIDGGVQIISKVETLSAVKNLDSILKAVEYILVDRGDLSTEIGLEKVPAFQKFIVDRALFFNKKVFLATQFLKTMETNPVPTIAEVVDLYNTFKMGVYGIQLSEETAVGAHVEKCLATIDGMLREIIHELKP
jgi:pyruvate kinase